jgi:hypothetical protein
VSSVGQEGVLGPARVAAPAVGWTGRAERMQVLLSRESPLIVAWGVMVTLWLFAGGGFAADSWLTLLGGREIVANGLPHHDSFAVISHGREWIDQQWLGQLFYYGVYKVGGLSLVSRGNVALFAAAAAVALFAARRSGALPTRVLVCAVPALLLTGGFVRSQVPAEVLFVLLLILLVRESRQPSWRILLAFPLLVVWANVHGSAMIGAALLSLLGLVELGRAVRRRRLRRGARASLLVLGAWPCLLVTPYGTDVVHYYHATLANPAFAKYITEWQAPRFTTFWGATFFVAAFFAAFVVGRRPRDFNAFELGVLLVTFAAGLLAVRSAIWFAYALVVLVPRALGKLSPPRRRSRTGWVPFRAAVATLFLGTSLFFLFQPAKGIGVAWPGGAARAVASAVRADPSLHVLANEQYADWLLFREPGLRERVAFDGRWEILRPGEMSAVVDFLFRRTPEWERISRGYGVFVLDPKTNRRVVEAYSRRHDMLTVYRDERVAVFQRRSSARKAGSTHPSVQPANRLERG